MTRTRSHSRIVLLITLLAVVAVALFGIAFASPFRSASYRVDAVIKIGRFSDGLLESPENICAVFNHTSTLSVLTDAVKRGWNSSDLESVILTTRGARDLVFISLASKDKNRAAEIMKVITEIITASHKEKLDQLKQSEQRKLNTVNELEKQIMDRANTQAGNSWDNNVAWKMSLYQTMADLNRFRLGIVDSYYEPTNILAVSMPAESLGTLKVFVASMLIAMAGGLAIALALRFRQSRSAS